MTSAEDSEHRVPTAEDEDRFWALVEQAWSQADGAVNVARRSLATRAADADPSADMRIVDGAAGDFLKALGALCEEMPADEITALDRVVERKLYDIDREEIQAVTDGSDDGFLYARGFIVALGRDYYEAVVADPAMAILDCDLESICYFFAHLHDRRFGAWPETGSGISRESCSNRAGWGA